MRWQELLDQVDELPRDPTDDDRPPAGVALYLSQMQRMARGARLSLPVIEYRLLAGLAFSGWSLRWALVALEADAQGVGPRSGTLNRAAQFLAKSGLWETINVRLNRRRSALVRLSPRGRDVLATVGIVAVESEWERIERLHRGDTERQLQHTGAICAFAYHVRRCGYDTQVCPAVAGPAEPDVAIVDRSGESFCVEIQGRGGEPWRRARKWQNLAHQQGQVAICTYTPAQALRYAREAQRSGIQQGKITDLYTLQHDNPPTLWTHRWHSRYSGLIPVQSPV